MIFFLTCAKMINEHLNLTIHNITHRNKESFLVYAYLSTTKDGLIFCYSNIGVHSSKENLMDHS